MKENLQNVINPKVYLEALEWKYIVVIDRAEPSPSLAFQNGLDTIAKTNKEPNRNTNRL